MKSEEAVGVLFKVNPAALGRVLALEPGGAAQTNDLARLKAFVEQYGANSIYEYTTF